MEEEFISLVNCEESQVLDVSRWEGRHSVGAPKSGQPGSKEAVDPVLYFGMHKGLKLSQVPRHYMEWLAGIDRPSSRQIRKICNAAKRMLN